MSEPAPRPAKDPEHVLYDASVGLRLVDSHLEELEPGSSPCACPPSGEGDEAPSTPAYGTLRSGEGREGTRGEGS